MLNGSGVLTECDLLRLLGIRPLVVVRVLVGALPVPLDAVERQGLTRAVPRVITFVVVGVWGVQQNGAIGIITLIIDMVFAKIGQDGLKSLLHDPLPTEIVLSAIGRRTMKSHRRAE